MAMSKLCFVTVGATASFDDLIKAVLTSSFLSALVEHGYSELRVQCGKGGKTVFDKALASTQTTSSKLLIDAFELDPAGLGKYMRAAKGKTPGKSSGEGVVISHAGSGSILDALRVAVPLVVVPNTTLLDNHQVELAEALAEQGYVVYGHLDKLEQALVDAEALRERSYQWPPVNSGKHRENHGLKGILDEEMGFLD